MEHDRLQLFDTKLAARILSMEDEELWEFVLSRAEQVKQMKRHDTGLYYAIPHGLEHFRKCFLWNIEEDRDKLLITLVNDFCFVDEPLDLSFRSRSAFLDSPESCDVRTSKDILPDVDEDSEAFYYLKYFHLLEPANLDAMLWRLKLPSEDSAADDPEQIAAITKMKNACLTQNRLKAVFIYDD